MQKYIDELLVWVASRKIKLNDIITHRLPIEEAPHAYDIFKNKKGGLRESGAETLMKDRCL